MEVNQEQSQRRGAKKIRFDNQELVKTSFWVSQIFMIIATVAGVYLAAQEGLSQAIKFDSLTNMQNNYHLQHSLYEELKDNVTVMTEYAERIEKEKPYNIKEYHPVMADFVWQNMKYSATPWKPPAISSPVPVVSTWALKILSARLNVSSMAQAWYQTTESAD